MLKVKFGQIFLAILLVISSAPNLAHAGQLNLGTLGGIIVILRAFSITPDLLNFYRQGSASNQAAAATVGDSESLVEYVSLLRGLSEQDAVELTFNLFHDSDLESGSNSDSDNSEDLGAPESSAAAAQAVAVVQHGSLFFSENGVFVPPPGVRQVQVIAIGGGAGGGAGGTSHRGGGGSGHLMVSTIDLRDGAPIAITIGDGGAGGTGLDSREGHAGGDTLFGDYMRAPGGAAPGQSMLRGGDGGSGGGAGGGSSRALPGGDGGRRGTNGQQLSNWEGGAGISSSAYIQLDPAVATDGPGGAGGRAGSVGNPGGGGGGGLIVHGQPVPTAGDGGFTDSNLNNFGHGGTGYGAGGGGGTCDYKWPTTFYMRGGRGAPGALLISW